LTLQVPPRILFIYYTM